MADIQEYSVSIKFETKGTDKAAKDVDKIKDNLGKLKKSTTGYDLISKSFSKIGASAKTALKSLAGAVSVAGIVKLGQSMSDLSKQTSDYIETVNLFRTSMGQAADEAEAFVNKAQDALGLDPSALMESLAAFQNLSEGFGIASDRAYTMSKNLTQLAGDLSSMYNMSFEQAQQKLMSGFSGQVLPLRKYGIALDQASLQELAYSLGLEQKVKSMTRAQKTELIYYQVMKSTSKMQGDLAKTLMSPANALRVLKNEFSQLARAVGSIFIPFMQKIIPIMRAVTKSLTQAATAIAKFFGFNIEDYTVDLEDAGGSLEGIIDDTDDLGDSAEGTAKKLNKMLMPFDELNNITSSNNANGSGSGAGVGGGSLGLDLPEYDMFEGINDKIQKFGDILEGVRKTAQKVNELLAGIDWNQIKNTASEWGANLGELLNVGAKEFDWFLIGETIAEGLNTAFTFVQSFIETTDFIALGNAIGNLIDGFFSNVEWDKVGNTISSGIKGALDTIITVMANFDPMKAYEAIWKFVSNIDWAGILNRLGKLLLIGFKNSPIMMVARAIAALFDALVNEIIEKLNNISIDVPDWVPGIGGETFGFDLEYVDIAGGFEENVNNFLGLTEYMESEYEETLDKGKETTVKTFDEIEDKTFKTLDETSSEIANQDEKPFIKWGSKVLMGYNEGLQSETPSTYNLFDKLNKNIQGKISMFKDTEKYGADTLENYNKGLNSQKMNTETAFNKIKTVIQQNLNLTNESNTWGADTLNNYNLGVKSEENNTSTVFGKIDNIIKEKLNQSLEAKEYATSTIEGYNEGVNSEQNSTSNMFDRIRQTIQQKLNQAEVARSLGSQTATGYKEGFEQTGNRISVMSTIKEKIKQSLGSYNESYYWGADMATGFKDGLSAKQQELIAKVREMANSIKSLLHFSRPDEGPLRDYETWMPDMIKGLSDSLVQAAPILENTVAQIANTLAESLRNIALPDVESSLLVEQNATQLIGNIGNKTNVATKDNVTANMIRATYEAVSKALTDTKATENNKQPIVVNLGNKELYNGFGQYQDEQSNMLGINV